MLKRTILSCALSLTSLTAINAQADSIDFSVWSTMPAEGRVQFSAASGDADLGIFGADAMQPLLGSSRHFAYGDFATDYATDATYLISPGIGYRGVYNNQILGAYAFVDYQKTNSGQNFWVLSPGIEWMNPHWDAHFNLYFPTNHTQEDGSAYFASNNGDYNYVTFQTGTNNQYDALMQNYDVIGNGADTEVGYRFAMMNNLSSRVYGGSYYYQPPGDTQNIIGGTLGFQQALTKDLSVAIFNSYDEVNHYAAGISVTYTLGKNSNTYSDNVDDRLLDPVKRHVGIIDTGAGTYDQQTTENLGEELQYNNVYFISVNGTGNGTYGSPYDLSQTTLDSINASSPTGARIYIQSGAAYTVNSSNTSDRVTLGSTYYALFPYANQDFYGRTTDYTAPASGATQPLIIFDESNNGAFILTNGGENTFANLTLADSAGDGTNTQNAIILGDSSGNASLTLSNVNILNAHYGVYVYNAGSSVDVDIENSTFLDNAYGVSLNNGGTLNLVVNNSNFSVNGTDGIDADNTGSLDMIVSNSNFSGNTNGVAVTQDGTSFDMTISNSNFSGNTEGITATITTNVLDMTVNNSTFSSNTDGITAANTGALNMTVNSSAFSGNVTSGINVTNESGSGTLDITANNSTFVGNGGSSTGAYGGIIAADDSTGGAVDITANNSTFSSNVSGIYANNSSANTIDITANNDTFLNQSSYGIYAGNDGTSNGGTVNTTTNNSTFSGNIYGIYATNATNTISNLGTFNITANNSTFSTNVNGIGADNEDGTASINLYNSSIYGGSIGIYANNATSPSTNTFNINYNASSVTGNAYNYDSIGTITVTVAS